LRFALWLFLGLIVLGGASSAFAQTNGLPLPAATNSIAPFKLKFGIEGGSPGQDLDLGIKVLFTITLLTLAPSIILLMTSFTRIVIVLSFIRSALSLQGTPANQILIGLSLFITFFIMQPVWENIIGTPLSPTRQNKSPHNRPWTPRRATCARSC
jgi:flagellar biosynthetic protein FliP